MWPLASGSGCCSPPIGDGAPACKRRCFSYPSFPCRCVGGRRLGASPPLSYQSSRGCCRREPVIVSPSPGAASGFYCRPFPRCRYPGSGPPSPPTLLPRVGHRRRPSRRGGFGGLPSLSPPLSGQACPPPPPRPAPLAPLSLPPPPPVIMRPPFAPSPSVRPSRRGRPLHVAAAATPVDAVAPAPPPPAPTRPPCSRRHAALAVGARSFLAPAPPAAPPCSCWCAAPPLLPRRCLARPPLSAPSLCRWPPSPSPAFCRHFLTPRWTLWPCR